MTPEERSPEKEEVGKSAKRPLLLSVLCLFSFVYFGILAVLFLLAAFYGTWITEIVNQYMPREGTTAWAIRMIFITGFLLHATAFSGTILLWNQRRIGYFLFAIPALIIAIYHLFKPEISWYSTAVNVLLIILFGIHFKRLK